MTKRFFRQLMTDKVRYLLISGQATVLYGASTFSEDLDIWLDHEQNNVRRFLSALRKLRARYYKLTPPMTPACLRKGHGFHFVLTGRREADWYLDVMGRPPRVPGFVTAARRAVSMQTDWGLVPVLGLTDLVEIKKTQRLEDYAVISRLTLIALKTAILKPSRRNAVWAVRNVFSLAVLGEMIRSNPWVVKHMNCETGAIKTFARCVTQGRAVDSDLEQRVEIELLKRMLACQAADRQYWRGIIAALKDMRAQGSLMTEGKLV